MTIKTILTPCDFSPTSMLAIEKACQLAEQLRAELHLVHVEEGESESDYQRVALDRLLAAVPPAYELQNKVHRHVLSGRVQDSLLKYVNECNADLIVMGSRGRSPFLQLAMGSVAQRILKNAPCPVMMVTQDNHNHHSAPDEATNTYLSLKTSDSPALDLLARAISLRATDIHIDPLEHEEYGVRLRIDGSVISYCAMDQGVAERLIQQYLTLAGVDHAEPFRPREGRLQLPATMQGVEARLTATPVAGGEAMALRLFSKENVFLPLEGLGFSDTGLETVLRMLRGTEGLILVTGPTGSGKTTTVYSMLHTYGKKDCNIVSIEDPVEFDVPFVRQLNVDERHGVTMASGLRTLLRMDPDILFLGEIRDPESASIAMRAASSGRFVFSSLHTRDVASTITAFRDLGGTDHSLAANLVGVVNQRLVRKLCLQCRKAVEPSEPCKEAFASSGLSAPAQVYGPVGCEACRGTGFKGRIGVFECVSFDDDLAQAITRNATEVELRDQIRSRGIASLTTEALKKVGEGLTSFDEANSVRWL